MVRGPSSPPNNQSPTKMGRTRGGTCPGLPLPTELPSRLVAQEVIINMINTSGPLLHIIWCQRQSTWLWQTRWNSVITDRRTQWNLAGRSKSNLNLPSAVELFQTSLSNSVILDRPLRCFESQRDTHSASMCFLISPTTEALKVFSWVGPVRPKEEPAWRGSLCVAIIGPVWTLNRAASMPVSVQIRIPQLNIVQHRLQDTIRSGLPRCT